MRSRAYSRGAKRRKKRRISQTSRFVIMGAVIALVVVAAAGTAAVKFLGGSGYNDEKEFIKFADGNVTSVKDSDELGFRKNQKEETEYGEEMSRAVRYPVTGIESVDSRVRDYIRDEEKKEKRFSERNFKGKNHGRLKKAARITGFSTFKGDIEPGTGSIAMYTVYYTQKPDGKLEKTDETVRTINFLEEKKIAVSGAMVFKNAYRDQLVSYAEKYLEDNYKDSLTGNYRKKIENGSWTDNFIIRGDTAEFFIDSGDAAEGGDCITVDISGDDPDIFRDEIKTRAIDPSKPMVALTFDDGPAAGKEAAILDTLKEYGGVATFFLQGINVERASDADQVLRRMLEEGSEIGSHSYDHPKLTSMSDKAVKEQNDKTDRAIEKITGEKPTVYRPPYGLGDERTTKIFGKPGALWSVDTLDWKSRNADSVVSVVKNSGDLDGDVILMHSIYDSSVEAAQRIIPWLVKEGYQLVTVSELLTYKYNQDPSRAEYYGYGYFN